MVDTAEIASRLTGRRVLVTGGAGFIGAHLTRALVEGGAVVSVIDDFSSGLTGNLADVADRVHLVHGSLLDAEALAAAAADVSVVFHLAAIASVPRSIEEPALYLEMNTVGTQRVLDAARHAKAERFIFASSSSVYGDQPGLPRVESLPPDPKSPYAASKSAGEHLVRAYAHVYGISALSLRYFNIFGPGQRADSPYAAVIPRFIMAMLDGRRPVVFGDGGQTRDFTHVSNAVRANLLAATCERPLRGEAVNIGCGRSTSVNQLVDAVAKAVGVDPERRLAPARAGDVRHSVASVEAAGQLIGYEPTTTFEAGLADMLA